MEHSYSHCSFTVHCQGGGPGFIVMAGKYCVCYVCSIASFQAGAGTCNVGGLILMLKYETISYNLVAYLMQL